MISVPFAELVFSTDGDAEALKLLHENVALNVDPTLNHKIVIKRLTWGNREEITAIKELGSFEVIIGTDVTYYTEAISPLFETACELMAKNDGEARPALVLCHIQRRVDEESLVETASQFGLKLVDRWMNGVKPEGSKIGSWCFSDAWMGDFRSTPWSILYFEV